MFTVGPTLANKKEDPLDTYRTPALLRAVGLNRNADLGHWFLRGFWGIGGKGGVPPTSEEEEKIQPVGIKRRKQTLLYQPAPGPVPIPTDVFPRASSNYREIEKSEFLTMKDNYRRELQRWLRNHPGDEIMDFIQFYPKQKIVNKNSASNTIQIRGLIRIDEIDSQQQFSGKMDGFRDVFFKCSLPSIWENSLTVSVIIESHY